MKDKIFILILLAILLLNSNCQFCSKTQNSIDNKQCFNNIKMFDIENKHYRAGHSSINKNGDLVIEYSYLQHRLFFGLKNNGEYFFPNEIKEIEIESDGSIDANTIRRYESINSFVSLVDDIYKEKEYLISISSYKTVLELHDLENEKYSLMETVQFTNTEKGVFSFVFQLLEAQINNQNIYFCIYIYSDYLTSEGGNKLDFGNTFVIKKLNLDSFDLKSINLLREIHSDNGRNRITSSILVESYQLLLVFSIQYNSSIYTYFLYYYDYDLHKLGEKEIYKKFNNLHDGYGMFFKSYVLFNDYVAFIYLIDSNKYMLQIWKLTEDDNYHNYVFTSQLTFTDNEFNLDGSITLNDFIKIDEDRLALISTCNKVDLIIILFDLYNYYSAMKVRYYHFFLHNEKINNIYDEISGFIYNGYLAFTVTVSPQGATNDDIIFPILIIFGYANSTDLEIDISPYFIDSDKYSSSINLISDLIEHLQIDNNIFSYEIDNKILLTSIPPEIIFYNSGNNNPLNNGDILDINYILKQNNDIVKENRNYSLEFQFILTEADYSTFYDNAYLTKDVIGDNDISDLSNYFYPKKFYSRNNLLQFKLCYNSCENCRKFDSNELGKKCETCLSNYKFYIDKADNGKICFDESFPCPETYPNYDPVTKECSGSLISTTILSTISPTNPITTISLINPISTIFTISSTYEENTLEMSNCTIEELKHTSCSKLNYTNAEINQKINKDLIPEYNPNEGSIEIKGEGNTIFQLTTTGNEFKIFSDNEFNSSNLSIVILGECENLLKQENGIDKNLSLIIKKVEQLAISAERNVQYEVYDPITKKKLNLSICEKESIDIYIPINMEENLINLYKDLKKSGYDLFNINDPFYNDICSQYKSKNGTDVLLSDRKNDYYNNDYTTCQSNCEYSSFNPEYKFLKCECRVIVDDIDVQNFHKFKKKIFKNFYDVLLNSNYKVMKCYNLVFNWRYNIYN